jgi:GT2 family glycosyltransferase
MEAPPPLVSVIVPVYNKRDVLRASLDSIVAAARRYGAAELIFIDHHSTDGSYELLVEYRDVALVRRLAGGNVSALRNHAAREAHGEVLVFFDCDCVVPVDFFEAMFAALDTSGATAVGCEVGLPTRAHWIEQAWYDLHALCRDGERKWLNAADFAVRRAAFMEVGGFDEQLVSGEDTDIGARLRSAGYRLYESQRLRVVHLGNPKSLRDFYRREAWHGAGVLSSASLLSSKATWLVFAHAAAVILALTILLSPLALSTKAFLASGLCLCIPVATVALRVVTTRRLGNPLTALLLYVVYYFARASVLPSAFVKGIGQRWRTDAV